MKYYKENDGVIYTDNEGNRFDTFVIFDTDRQTGLTYINFRSLRVPAQTLKLRPQSAGTMPIRDPYSFELFRQLKEKYRRFDRLSKRTAAGLSGYVQLLPHAKASYIDSGV